MATIRKKLKMEHLGKLVLPDLIFGIKLHDELKRLYERVFYKTFNYSLVGFSFISITLLSSILYLFLIYPLLYQYFPSFVLGGVIWNFFFIFVSYVILNYLIFSSFLISFYFYLGSKEKREEEQVEKELPEFIENLVSNLKGGISLEKALVNSVRPEQKALKKEIMLVNQRIMLGEDAVQAIRSFRERFNSAIINRTLFLIEEGLKGGGKLTGPLEKISENLRRVYNLNEEIHANAVGFTIVMRVLTIFVAPLLFALAITLLNFIGEILAIMAETEVDEIPVAYIPPIFTDYLIFFSYSMIFLITIFSSLIIHQLKGDRLYQSFKYMPIVVLLALTLFTLFTNVLMGFFGGIIE